MVRRLPCRPCQLHHRKIFVARQLRLRRHLRLPPRTCREDVAERGVAADTERVPIEVMQRSPGRSKVEQRRDLIGPEVAVEAVASRPGPMVKRRTAVAAIVIIDVATILAVEVEVVVAIVAAVLDPAGRTMHSIARENPAVYH